MHLSQQAQNMLVNTTKTLYGIHRNTSAICLSAQDKVVLNSVVLGEREAGHQ